MNDLSIRPACKHDLPALEEIRAKAFAPVFSSFRDLLGDYLYELVQLREDAAQSEMLASMFAQGSPWLIYAGEVSGNVVGFVAVKMNNTSRVGEIGLNAVHPDYAGRGIGTAMCEFSLSHMKNSGMLAATVSTGGDASHAPARRAYEKTGFKKSIPSVWMCREL